MNQGKLEVIKQEMATVIKTIPKGGKMQKGKMAV